MKIGVSAQGQFGFISGIQYYVDSLLGALYESDTRHEIVALIPSMPLRSILDAYSTDGFFQWLQHPRARVALGGVSFRLQSLRQNARWRETALHLVDSRLSWALRRRTATFRARLDCRRFDVFHTADTGSPDFDLVRGKTNVITLYDMTTRVCAWAHTPFSIALWERMYRYAQRRCARVITISASSKADIAEHLGIPEDRIDVTPLAARSSASRICDPRELQALLDPFDLSRQPFILYAGTLEPRKNLPRLVTAFHRVISEARLPHTLILAGGNAGGQHDREIRELSERLGVAGRVLQTGYVSNAAMNALMTACEAFVYISQYEGFGLPPLEAMVCGAPVISSNVSSLPEVVGDAALLVSPTDVDAIAAAILLLLTDKAENARRRALSKARAKLFTWQRTAQLTLQSYEAALG